MLPPTRQLRPSPPSRCPTMLVVVLFPLVPVMQTTRSKSASSSHSPSPPTTVTPWSPRAATSGRYRLIPGVFTTTSHRARASQPPEEVASTGMPADSAGGRSSATTGVAPMASSFRRLAPPSTPRPHTPTVAPARSDQEILGREVIGDVMGIVGREQGGDLGGADPGEGLGQALEQRVVAAVAHLAHALEGLGVGRQTDQHGEAIEQVGPTERLATVEDRLQLDLGEERREDEVDEAALVALTAPAVEPPGRVD